MADPAAPQGEDPRVERIRRAHETVSDLCHGRKDWRMSIPARVDEDPDLVIGAALRDADALVAENAKLREALAKYGDHDVDCYPLDCRCGFGVWRAALDPSSTGTK